jgi:hypothetical protein
MRVCVVLHQAGKSTRSFHNAVGMLIEHLEKIALAGQQLPKQHGELLNMTKQ